jgi:hypothetical protein
MMDLKSLTDWVIRGIVAFFLLQAIEFMKETKLGLQDLSVKLAVIVEKVTNQDRLIDMHEKRIQQLEREAK